MEQISNLFDQGVSQEKPDYSNIPNLLASLEPEKLKYDAKDCELDYPDEGLKTSAKNLGDLLEDLGVVMRTKRQFNELVDSLMERIDLKSLMKTIGSSLKSTPEKISRNLLTILQAADSSTFDNNKKELVRALAEHAPESLVGLSA